MLVNKKLDRLKQWSKEKLGAEGRTGTSEEVKTMMAEMELLSGGKSISLLYFSPEQSAEDR